MDWKEKYPKGTKPPYEALLAFFQPNIRELFLSFDREMKVRFNVVNKYHRYMKTAGWAYGFGRGYSCELLAVTVNADCFHLLGICVKDESTLQAALAKAQEKYDDGFEAYCAAVSLARRENQIARSKRRVAREQAQMKETAAHVDPEKFNKFKWCRKVPRNDILRLYQSDAKGLLDEALLDDIGFTFYTRCIQAKEAYERMDKGEIICHHCHAILKAGQANALIHCGCGYVYTYREYRRSCNAANMPAGAATPIFHGFIPKWAACKDAKSKMMLIDWLIHQFHVALMADVKGRSVCRNLIEGTTAQIFDLINRLAYGDVLSKNKEDEHE